MTRNVDEGSWAMARYGSEHKQATRERILDTAGRRLKADGVVGSGVATLMADAGLTNGAFYAHFASKDDLVAAVLTDQLSGQRQILEELLSNGPAGLGQYVRDYLSTGHRDAPAEGCPSAALLDEVSRAGLEVREAYSQGLLDVIDVIAGQTDPGDATSARLRVLSAFAGMVGTLQMARALADRTLSDALLELGVMKALAELGVR